MCGHGPDDASRAGTTTVRVFAADDGQHCVALEVTLGSDPLGFGLSIESALT